MKIPARATLVLVTALAAVAVGFTEPPAVMLPKEGAWIRYHGVTQKGGESETIFTYTHKSLNKSIVDGKPCRWFETEEKSSYHHFRKYLITERGFTSSERPFDEVLRYLQLDNSEPLAALDPGTEGMMPTEFLFFPGFLKNAKLTDAARTVNYQRGTLTIPQAYVGTYQWRRKGSDPEKTSLWESKYQVWLHPDLPTGFAHAKMRLGISYQGKENRFYDIEYTLQDFGDDAKPAIAEESAPLLMP